MTKPPSGTSKPTLARAVTPPSVPVEADRQLPHRNGRGGGGFSDRRRRGGRRHPICFLRDSVASRIFVVMTSSTVGVSPLNCFSSA